MKINTIQYSPFLHKIIGGMCWCIELCNIDIDIDLFYQDSLTIGQKMFVFFILLSIQYHFNFYLLKKLVH